ncbi:MAG: hypothetical protein CSA49_04250 [Gammaproteobacteria bacterium]|nr:MAG: hypothetical protein CSA49_04250 [Gammaproteobacteria bacterium]
MRWIFDIYLPFAKRSQRELRSPAARLLVSVFCFFIAGVLVWKVFNVYQSDPDNSPGALFYLAVPLLGAAYLLYVVYLALFASGQRVRKGLISVFWLKVLGYSLVPTGFWLLSQGRLDGAVVIIAGLACLGLVKRRGEWFFGDE